MFHWFEVRIRRLPVGAQLAAWPFYFVFLWTSQILGWFFAEAFGQAKRKGKKVVAPLAWPLLIMGAIAASGFLFGSEVMSGIIELLIIGLLIFVAVRVVVYGFK